MASGGTELRQPTIKSACRETVAAFLDACKKRGDPQILRCDFARHAIIGTNYDSHNHSQQNNDLRMEPSDD